MSFAPHPKNDRSAAQALDAGLYIVATPIGALRDITLRALDTLASVDAILAEDTRVTAKLLAAHGVRTPMEAYHEHNAAAVRPRVLARLAEGARLALVSDAGTPLISDPGFKLVREAIEAGARVIPVPGACAPIAALSVAGLPTDRFLFVGFAPNKREARRALADSLRGVQATLVLFETGPRLAESLADFAGVLGGREAVVAREITKLHEEFARAPLPELAARYANAPPPLGEIVLLIGPPDGEARWSQAAVDSALSDRLQDGSVKDVAADVADLSGWGRREVYARALALKSGA